MSQEISQFKVRSLTGAVIIFVSATNLLATPGDCNDHLKHCADNPCPCEMACYYDQECPPGMVCSLSAVSPLGCYCNSAGVWEILSDSTANACVPAPISTKPPIYTIKDLGTLGGSVSIAHAINNRGQVVGEAQNTSGYPEAFLWDGGSKVGLAGWPTATALNNSTQVLLRYPYRSAVWEKGKVRLVGFDESDNSLAVAMNDSGAAIGSAWDSTSASYKRFIWREGVISELEIPLGFADINNFGQIAGSIQPAGSYIRAAVWDGEEIIDFGAALGGQYSFAIAMNDYLEVVGVSERAPGGDRNFYSFVWRGGDFIDLSNIAGVQLSLGPHAINNCGDVLKDGFVFNRENAVAVLDDCIDPTLRWYQILGEGINDYGQVVGSAVRYGVFETTAVLLTPIRGDMNRDGDVDLQDFAQLQRSYTGAQLPGIPNCERADLDRDADVDLSDLTMLDVRLNGPCQAPLVQ